MMKELLLFEPPEIGAIKEVAKKTQGLIYRTKPMRLLTFNGSTFDLKYLAIHGATGLRGCRRQLL